MTGPLIVLHVCMGNICRSPMAERLLAHAVEAHGGEDLVLSESAGTGSWHTGERMNPPAEAELQRRGIGAGGFRARKLMGSHVDTAGLVLTATSEQFDFVLDLRPDALARTFVLGEFGRLASRVDATALPAAAPTAAAMRARGLALVAAVGAARGNDLPRLSDDLDDPWGRSSAFFTGTADRIASSLAPLVDALFPSNP